MERLFINKKPWRFFGRAEIIKITKRDCIQCKFSAGSITETNQAGVTCDYITIMKHSRPCQPGQCRKAGVFEIREQREG